jgi:ABC-type antimicrobial peptide transport system permease subunit
MRADATVKQLELTLVDPAFPAVLSMGALEGDLQAALSRPDALALTDETAQILFGTPHVVGRSVTIKGQNYQVAAVLRKQPVNSSVQFQALAGLNSGAWPETERKRAHDNLNYYPENPNDFINNKVYARLPPGTRRADLVQALSGAIEASPLRSRLGATSSAEVGSAPLLEVAFGPLADSYMDSGARSNSGPKGNPVANYAMSAVAFMILLLTAGNYVNLATIRVIERQREMAVRKAVGVSRHRLLKQMLAESVLVSLLAALLGAGLAALLLPAWSDLTGHQIGAVLGLREWLLFGLLVVAMGTVVGLVAGMYPAWIALRMRTLDGLGGRGNSETTGGIWLRRVLTVLQFSIAMLVTGVVITIAWQIDYLKRIDYGYQLDSLLTISIPEGLDAGAVRGFTEAAARLPEVKGISRSGLSPSAVDFTTTRSETVSLKLLPVSPSYFATIGLGAAAGRVFDAAIDPVENANVVVINSVAAQRLGYADAGAALGQLVNVAGAPKRIVGISKPVSNGFMDGPLQPLVYDIRSTAPHLLVNGGATPAAAKTALETLWRTHFPDHVLAIRNLRAQLEMNASGPRSILQVCVIVAMIMVPLAVFSIYALSAYAVQRRAREIVLRKLHGAQPMDIARLLTREFAILLAVAAVLGLPLSFVFGRMFLEQFADQAGVGGWAVAASLLGAVLVTLAATSRHTLIAARLSPVAALRAS